MCGMWLRFGSEYRVPSDEQNLTTQRTWRTPAEGAEKTVDGRIARKAMDTKDNLSCEKLSYKCGLRSWEWDLNRLTRPGCA